MKIAIVTDLHIGYVHKKIRVFKDQFLKKLDADLLIISGDIGSSKQSEIELLFKTARETRPILPILVVFGNHDFWDGDREFTSILEIDKFHSSICKKYNIHQLENNKYEVDDVVFYGFNGWYKNPQPPSNDLNWMPNDGDGVLDPMRYLQRKETIAINYILDDIEVNSKKKIVITHFNPVVGDRPEYSDMSGDLRIPEILCPKINMLVFGHTHVAHDSDHLGCQLLNVGAHYSHSPNLKINKYYKIIKI